MSRLGNFACGIADQLRGVYKSHQYGGVILPFTILRRLDCVLEPTRDEVRTLAEPDMIAKGQDAGNIRLGGTLADDQFWDRTFAFWMSNPPNGFDRKAAHEAVEKEALAAGTRSSHSLPSIGDGQTLLMCHLRTRCGPGMTAAAAPG
ncbi:type I restriction-modification system subunit M N-terminal domain-containing protein [Mycobacterium lacus]|uniref:N6 adenine-specific DNA methyltransferase N-terminal domain-containing protein n=1 Tax=Mycobacterium lacus TaxID=169765 RepID=A0A1X1YUC3_9MYCO|nr:type I restriction-modification system subunit M N-terminal domain-containing protein [Mycobacterium lacus]ORW14561.1 hypothetical protein AWC15_13010 [Mycobacterium lacus]BBX95579.1 hypothetical protein MLAC_08730 [Mycobacterium lacus]